MFRPPIFWAALSFVTALGCLTPISEATALRFTDHPLSGRIYDVNRDTFVTEAVLLEKLAYHQFILVGERHDNSDHHRIEQRLLKQLVDRNSRVVFEMLDETQQARLGTLDAHHPLDKIRETLDWPENRWSWDDYGPLFHTVLTQGGVLVAGSPCPTRVRAIYRGEDAELGGYSKYGPIHVLSEEQRQKILDQLYLSHCETMPRSTLNPMLAVQAARDSTMAHAMLLADQSVSPSRTILVAGAYHTRRDLGVPRHIAFLDPMADFVVLQLEEVDPKSMSPRDYAMVKSTIADYVWFSPAAPEQDYCADLRPAIRSGQ